MSDQHPFWTLSRKLAVMIWLGAFAGLIIVAIILYEYYQLSWEARTQIHYYSESSEFHRILDKQWIRLRNLIRFW